MTNTTKAPKVTLNSILFAELPALRVLAEGETHTKDELAAHKTALAEAVQGIASNLAGYLINKVSADSVNVYGDILKATAKRSLQYWLKSKNSVSKLKRKLRHSVKLMPQQQKKNASRKKKSVKLKNSVSSRF